MKKKPSCATAACALRYDLDFTRQCLDRISYLERFRLCTRLQCFILKVMSCDVCLNSCLDLISEYLVMSKKTGHKSGALSRAL